MIWLDDLYELFVRILFRTKLGLFVLDGHCCSPLCNALLVILKSGFGDQISTGMDFPIKV